MMTDDARMDMSKTERPQEPEKSEAQRQVCDTSALVLALNLLSSHACRKRS